MWSMNDPVALDSSAKASKDTVFNDEQPLRSTVTVPEAHVLKANWSIASRLLNPFIHMEVRLTNADWNASFPIVDSIVALERSTVARLFPLKASWDITRVVEGNRRLSTGQLEKALEPIVSIFVFDRSTTFRLQPENAFVPISVSLVALEKSATESSFMDFNASSSIFWTRDPSSKEIETIPARPICVKAVTSLGMHIWDLLEDSDRSIDSIVTVPSSERYNVYLPELFFTSNTGASGPNVKLTFFGNESG